MSRGDRKKPDKASPFAVLEKMRAKVDDTAKKDDAKRAQPSPAKRAPPSVAKTAAPPEDDALTFHRMMSGVTPLDRKAARVPKSAQALEPSMSAELAARRQADGQAAAQAEADEVRERLRALVEGNARFEVEDDGRRVEGRRVDLPADMLRKLRRGIVPIDARIDLHGMGAGEAHDAVEAFLRDKRTRGEKCVLLVHGKGEHSPRGRGILRGEIAAWLSQGIASEHVAAFSTALAEDGGEGAVYVLLRS